MSPRNSDAIEQTIAELSKTSDDALTKAQAEGLPDRDAVAAWVDRTLHVVLAQRDRSALRSEIPWIAEHLRRLVASLPASSDLDVPSLLDQFLPRLAGVRALLAQDVEAAYAGDPAARSFAEIVAAYPSLRAIATYRIAHELHLLRVPILPRVMTEYAHDHTGIDIHPGASIGRRFFIDHGTGVVIGETTSIGDDVRLYQGVTLGALAPRHGESLRGRKRHPSIEDDVTIYAGATILGGDTLIGRGSVIGGNVWLIQSVPPGSKVIAEPPQNRVKQRGKGEAAETLQLHWDI